MTQSAVFPLGFDPGVLAEEVANYYSSYQTGKAEWNKKTRETIQYVYATSTRETINANVGGEEGEGWSHSTHIPKLTQIHDNLGANYYSALMGGRNWFTFAPGAAEKAPKTKLKTIVQYLRTKHEWNGIEKVLIQLLNDWVQTGNCFARVIYVNETSTNEITGEEEVIYQGPKVQRISPYDIVFDHRATSFDDTPVIIRSVVDRGGLLNMTQEQPDLGYDMEEVRKALEFRNLLADVKDSEINKTIQHQYDGFQNAAEYFGSGDVELLEFVGDIYDPETMELKKNHVITVADRRFVLRAKPLNRADGRRSIHHAAWRVRPDNLWGMSPLENLVGLQYRINHLENARADAFDQMLAPDRVHIGNVQVEEDGPVTNYYVDDAQGDVRNLAPDATVLNADFQIGRLEAQMDAYAGAPAEAMGIRTPGEKTKFEVQQLQNAAGRLFQHKIDQFERDFLEPILNSELECTVRNLSSSDIILTLDDDLGTQEMKSITRADLTAKGKIKAQGASHFAKKAQAVQETSQLNNMLAGDPSLAVHFPAKQRAQRLSDALELPEGVFTPFGAVAEQVELAKAQQAAQRVMDRNTAAAQGNEDLV